MWKLTLQYISRYSMTSQQGCHSDWKNQGKSHKILEKPGNFIQLLFIIFVIFKWTVYYLLKWIIFSVKKDMGQGILSVKKSENHAQYRIFWEKFRAQPFLRKKFSLIWSVFLWTFCKIWGWRSLLDRNARSAPVWCSWQILQPPRAVKIESSVFIVL